MYKNFFGSRLRCGQTARYLQYVRCGGAGHWVSVSAADVLNGVVAGPAEQHDPPGAHQVAAAGVALVRDVVQR